jgi:hypothetical protein
MAQLGLPVVRVNKHQLGRVTGHLIFVDLGKGRDDDQIAARRTACGRAVHRNHACPTLAANGRGDEALAVVDVPDVDLLVLCDVGGIKQVFVDGTGTS